MQFIELQVKSHIIYKQFGGALNAWGTIANNSPAVVWAFGVTLFSAKWRKSIVMFDLALTP